MKNTELLLQEIKSTSQQDIILAKCVSLLDIVNFLILEISFCKDQRMADTYFNTLEEIQLITAMLYYQRKFPLPESLKHFTEAFNLMHDDAERTRLFKEIQEGKYSYDERHDILLLNFLKEIIKEPINTDLSEQFNFLHKEICSLFTKIRSCADIQQASYYFYLLGEIQSTLAILAFKYDIAVPASFENFISDFDRIDDKEWRVLLFQKIQSGEYDLLPC